MRLLDLIVSIILYICSIFSCWVVHMHDFVILELALLCMSRSQFCWIRCIKMMRAPRIKPCLTFPKTYLYSLPLVSAFWAFNLFLWWIAQSLPKTSFLNFLLSLVLNGCLNFKAWKFLYCLKVLKWISEWSCSKCCAC